MRGQDMADKFSVELYLRKFESFMMALNRTDPKGLNSDSARNHLNKINETFSQQLMDEKYLHFIPFAQILVKLCSLVDLSKNEARLEEYIEQKQEQISKNNKEVE